MGYGILRRHAVGLPASQLATPDHSCFSAEHHRRFILYLVGQCMCNANRYESFQYHSGELPLSDLEEPSEEGGTMGEPSESLPKEAAAQRQRDDAY